MSEKKVMNTGKSGKGQHELTDNANTEKLEERALSVFSSERNEDLTALAFCLLTTFVVLVFTKWMV